MTMDMRDILENTAAPVEASLDDLEAAESAVEASKTPPSVPLDDSKGTPPPTEAPTPPRKPVAKVPPGVRKAARGDGVETAKPAKAKPVKEVVITHAEKMVSARKWGRDIQRFLDKGKTMAFRSKGIDYRWNSEVLNRELGQLEDPITLTVLYFGVDDDDDIDFSRLTVGEAIGYHVAGLGLKGLKGLGRWLKAHPWFHAIIGVIAILVQDGYNTTRVAEHILNNMQRPKAEPSTTENPDIKVNVQS